MSNKDKREALAAAASVFCAADVPASEVIEHAQAFEEYLAGGRVTLATDSEFTESRARLLHQLANFVSKPGYLGLANWLRSVAVALELNEPWPLPERADGRSADDVTANARLNLLVQLQRVAKGAGRPELVGWLGKVSDALDRSNEPEAVELPRLEPEDVTALEEARSWARHGYEIAQRTASWSDHGVAPKWLTEGHDPALLTPATARDPFAEAPWGGKGSVEPPAEIRAVTAANGATLERTSWKTADGHLWEWYGLGLTGHGPKRWDEALELAPDSVFPLTLSHNPVPIEAPRPELREDYPVPAEKVTPAEVDAQVGHDDPARSTNPSRYELRTIGDSSADDPEREVLVCLTCIEQQGPPAGSGNIVDVERHDAYHAEQGELS